MVWYSGIIKWQMGKWFGIVVQLNSDGQMVWNGGTIKQRWANGMEWWDN